MNIFSSNALNDKDCTLCLNAHIPNYHVCIKCKKFVFAIEPCLFPNEEDETQPICIRCFSNEEFLSKTYKKKSVNGSKQLNDFSLKNTRTSSIKTQSSNENDSSILFSKTCNRKAKKRVEDTSYGKVTAQLDLKKSKKGSSETEIIDNNDKDCSLCFKSEVPTGSNLCFSCKKPVHDCESYLFANGDKKKRLWFVCHKSKRRN